MPPQPLFLSHEVQMIRDSIILIKLNQCFAFPMNERRNNTCCTKSINRRNKFDYVPLRDDREAESQNAEHAFLCIKRQLPQTLKLKAVTLLT